MNANKSWNQKTNRRNMSKSKKCSRTQDRKGNVIIKRKIAAKHSAQCIAVVNRTNKRLAALCY